MPVRLYSEQSGQILAGTLISLISEACLFQCMAMTFHNKFPFAGSQSFYDNILYYHPLQNVAVCFLVSVGGHMEFKPVRVVSTADKIKHSVELRLGLRL